jgi:hypothetical protein
MSLIFNVDVARTLNFRHNESLNYFIINSQLIIKKDNGNGADDNSILVTNREDF